MSFIFYCSKEREQIVRLCKLGRILWRVCFISVISLAVQKLLKLLQGWSLTFFLGNYFQSGYLYAWQAFPRVYFTAGQGEIDSFSNLWFVIISITHNKSTYQCSDWGFTDRSVHSFALLGSFLTEIQQLLCWDDREQLPAVYTAVGTVDRCVLYICVWSQTKHDLGSLAIGLLGLLEPWCMYFTLFWGQCDFSGGRVDFQTTAFQWIDSAALKVISAGETIPTLVSGRQTSMSGCWCHVSLWMNISCAASSCTSDFPRVLWQPAVFAGTALPFALLIFILPQPCTRRAVTSNTHLLGRWLLMNPVSALQRPPAPGHSSPWMPVGFVGIPPFAEVILAVCESAPYGKSGLC